MIPIPRHFHSNCSTALKILSDLHPKNVLRTIITTNTVVKLEPALHASKISLLIIKKVPIITFWEILFRTCARIAEDYEAELVLGRKVSVWPYLMPTGLIPLREAPSAPTVRLPIHSQVRSRLARVASCVGRLILITMPVVIVVLVVIAFSFCVSGVLAMAFCDIEDVAVVGSCDREGWLGPSMVSTVPGRRHWLRNFVRH